MTTKSEPTFEQLVAEYIEKTKAMVGEEVLEGGLPPEGVSPFRREGPPFESEYHIDEDTIKAYALSIGEDNPLYLDPSYGKQRFGSAVAPGCALILARGITAHGAHEARPEGYPLANFHSGVAWEFYDVLRAGTRLETSQVLKEVFIKKGAQGNLVFCISESRFMDQHGDQPGKAYATLIMVPQESMGTGRSMPVEKLGEKLMYSRGTSKYTAEQIADAVNKMDNKFRRGDEMLYWEDVEIGEKLPGFLLPPFTLQDQEVTSHARTAAPGVLNFEPLYRQNVDLPRARGVHPITRWPWGPRSEHTDALLCAYRGQSLPFDWGGQRAQIPSQLFTNWSGDHGFLRRWTSALRRPMYYSDIANYNGEVVKKFTEEQVGENVEGAVPGKRTYHAIGIKYEGTNQVGQTFVQGTATMYLPSRKDGPVVLPIPHKKETPFVPYETFYRDWY